MKPNIVILTLGVFIAIAGTCLLRSNAALASLTNSAKYSESNAVLQAKGAAKNANEPMTEGMTERQPAPTEIRQDVRQDSGNGTEQPSLSAAQTDNDRHTPQELELCRAYVPSYAKPGSFEYREGLDRCVYGSD
jgi:hypothetical protein